MANVKEVFVTKEVSDKFKKSAVYIIQIAKKLRLSEEEFRKANNTLLFSAEAVEKIKAYLETKR